MQCLLHWAPPVCRGQTHAFKAREVLLLHWLWLRKVVPIGNSVLRRDRAGETGQSSSFYDDETSMKPMLRLTP
jgi:hypothetical protein